jgi:UDP-N-acetylmuramate--alanine ligase
MRALAELLTDHGWKVLGRDPNCSANDRCHLEALGIEIDVPDGIPKLDGPSTLMIHSVAVPSEDPARQHARSIGLTDLSYPEFLGRLQTTRPAICVAGTHGKSTATALTAWILRGLGHRSGALVGAEFHELRRSGWDAGGGPLVIESCEYQRSFLNYHPQAAAILSVEPDHFDCYPNAAELHSAFRSFASRVAPGGRLVIVGADAPHLDWKSCTSAQLVRVSEELGDGPWDWSYDRLKLTNLGLEFRILRQGLFWSQARLLAGPRHNAINALVALALCDWHAPLDHPSDRERAIEALASFPGLHRRFQVTQGGRDQILIDDYAHHPTALSASIAAARSIFPGRRVLGVFQPHQISRTEALLPEFARALANLDKCFLTPVLAARENSTSQQNEALTERLRESVLRWGTPCETLFALDPIPRSLDDSFCSGDLLLTLGAGNISRLHDAFIQRFRRDHQAG